MVGDNTSALGLKDLLAQRSLDVSFHSTPESFWPYGSFDDLFTSEAVSAELWPPNEQTSIEAGLENSECRKILVAFILEKSKTIFAILLSFLKSGRELRQAINHFRDAGLDDSNLPITSKDIKCRIFYKPGNGSHYRQPWSGFREKNFCDVWQWRFTAPVFHHNQSLLGLHDGTILPFIKANSCGSEGSGHFGDIYEVTVHPAHIGSILPADRSVSIKKLYQPEPYDRAKVQDLEKSWKREVYAHEELVKHGHPNIIKFIAGITKGSDRYLMCEWANGGNLRDFWTKKENPVLTQTLVKDVINQLQGIADALKVIHDNNFRHGDLKPENIVRQETHPRDLGISRLDVGVLKICDMGLTKHHNIATEFRNFSTTTKFSTWRYEPPEATGVVRHQPRSRRFDVWSIGCIILEFIVWMLEGSDGLNRFNSEIVDDLRQACPYFEWKMRRDGQVIFCIHTAVEEKMKSLSSHPACTAGETALGDLLKIVGTKLLVVGSDDVNTKSSIRADSTDFKNEIEKIVQRGSEEQDYWLKAKDHKDLPNLHRATADTRTASERRLQTAKGQLTTERSSVTMPILRGGLRTQLSNVWDFSVDNTFATKVLHAIDQLELTPKYTTSTNYCAKCQHLEFWIPDFGFVDTWEELENNLHACDFCKMRWEICCHLDRKEYPLVKFQHDRSMLQLNENYPPVLNVRRGPDTSAEKLSHVQVAFPELPLIASQTYYCILRQWLRDCDADHPECSPQQLSYLPKLPTRLIHLRGRGSSAISIYETRPTDTFKYVALSHPWGKEPHFCTTSANVEAHRFGIDYETLPITFRHAVDATRSLGLEYLWIDSICIIQGEDGDFDQEAKRMEDVFSSAYCVLATSSARGQNDGFLKPRTHLRQCLTFDHKPGLPTLYVSPSMDNFNDDVLKAPLSKRGWVLQERALARRTIYFTERQTYWECGRGVRCETLAKMDNKLVSFLGDAHFPSKLSNKSTSRGEKIILYEGLYRQYTRLELTRMTDRPIAIAGLEKRIIRDLQIDGGFGVFDDDRSLLQRSLLWRRGYEVPVLVRIFPAPSSLSAPTWSWMAYEGGIDYLDLPLGGVDWLPSTQAVQSPWSSKRSGTWHTGDGKESVELKGWARPFAAGLGGRGLAANHEDMTIVYDNPYQMNEGREPMFVVVGSAKKGSVPQEDVLHYVLVIASCQGSLNAEGGSRKYERMGVGYMKGSLLDLESPPHAVIIC